MKEYKYLYFVKLASNTKTSVWSCQNKSSGTKLGIVKWYGAWRQYCYCPSCNLLGVYSAGCLDDISDFIKTAMQDRQDMVKEK